MVSSKAFVRAIMVFFTYHQERCGFSYFYCKRQVQSNGVDTKVLDIELCPEKRNTDDANYVNILLDLMDE